MNSLSTAHIRINSSRREANKKSCFSALLSTNIQGLSLGTARPQSLSESNWGFRPAKKKSRKTQEGRSSEIAGVVLMISFAEQAIDLLAFKEGHSRGQGARVSKQALSTPKKNGYSVKFVLAWL